MRNSEANPILQTRDLTVGYRTGKAFTPVLEGLNLTLACGRMAALLGRNGAGKSTLLRALTSPDAPFTGEIKIDGRDLREFSYRRLSRVIGLVSTTRQVMGALTVRELVALGRQPHTGLLGRLDSHDLEVVEKAMDATGITYKAETNVTFLSDGERQKVMIARALAQETPIVILDEPTAFLDVSSRIETMRLLHSLAHDHGKAVLLSSHDVSQSLLLADDLWLIASDGKVITGETHEVVAAGAMSSVFDSENLVFNDDLCDYEAVLPSNITVRLVCEKPAQQRVISNLLLRNGIAVASDAPICVTCRDLDRFSLDTGSEQFSFDKLTEKIKSLTQQQA